MTIEAEMMSEGTGDEGDEGDWTEIKNFLGPPHNYGPSLSSLNVQKSAEDEIERLTKARQIAQKLSEEALVKAGQYNRAQKSLQQLAEIKKQEAKMLADRSKALHTFMKENVMPTLTRGLMEVALARPDDPIDYLAEFLFRHTPDEDTEADPFTAQ